jgi:acetyltransferase-like isoleucine patch superfamily enzyme
VARRTAYEYGIGISIGDSVWLGGSVVVNPGVHIGSGAVIGSGSAVTKDIPKRVVAAGNPYRVIREITDRDRRFYYRDREFDVDDY